MTEKTQQESQNQIQGKVFISPRVLEMYIDLVVRGMISFIFIGVGGYLIFFYWLGFPIHFVFPLIFLASILISPQLSKIKLGGKIQNKYDDFLRKVIFHMNEYEKRKRK